MEMKKLILLTVFAGMLPIAMQAQDDDLYFTPKKSADKTSTQQSASQRSETPYYSGSSRDVDEYNRRPMHSYYETIGTDSLGNDIIEFHSGAEDSTKVFKAPDYDDESDYAYSRSIAGTPDGMATPAGTVGTTRSGMTGTILMARIITDGIAAGMEAGMVVLGTADGTDVHTIVTMAATIMATTVVAASQDAVPAVAGAVIMVTAQAEGL